MVWFSIITPFNVRNGYALKECRDRIGVRFHCGFHLYHSLLQFNLREFVFVLRLYYRVVTDERILCSGVAVPVYRV